MTDKDAADADGMGKGGFAAMLLSARAVDAGETCATGAGDAGIFGAGIDGTGGGMFAITGALALALALAAFGTLVVVGGTAAVEEEQPILRYEI